MQRRSQAAHGDEQPECRPTPEDRSSGCRASGRGRPSAGPRGSLAGPPAESGSAMAERGRAVRRSSKLSALESISDNAFTPFFLV